MRTCRELAVATFETLIRLLAFVNSRVYNAYSMCPLTHAHSVYRQSDKNYCLCSAER